MLVGAASPRESKPSRSIPRFYTSQDHLGSKAVIGNNVNESWVQFSGSRNEALWNCQTTVSSRVQKRTFLTVRKWIHLEKFLIFLSGSCECGHIGQRIFAYKIKKRHPILKAHPGVSQCVLNVITNVLIIKRKRDVSDWKERKEKMQKPRWYGHKSRDIKATTHRQGSTLVLWNEGSPADTLILNFWTWKLWNNKFLMLWFCFINFHVFIQDFTMAFSYVCVSVFFYCSSMPTSVVKSY